MTRLRLALLFAVLVPVMVVSQRRVDADLGVFRAQQEVLYFWSGQHVRRLWPGLENLMADVYWLRTVQYFGGQRVYAEGKRFDLLWPLTDITVTLDPRFEIAYHYGAIFLAEPIPFGAGQPEKGVELLDRGARATGSWRLRQYQGYFTFLHLCDPRRAVAVLQDAASLPGAPYWLNTLAADMLGRSGDRATAIQMWKTMSEQSAPGPIRNNALFNLSYLEGRQAIDALQAEVEAFKARTGRAPQSLSELHLPGKPPMDSTGAAFEYDQKTGKVWFGARSILWRPAGGPSSTCIRH